ncbi:MAG: glycosyltransferase family 4 protein, partial [Bacteroidota bacterium]
MKVLLICKSLNTALGGIQTHTRFLATYLARQGLAVHILTGRSWQDRPENRLENVKVISLKHLPGYRLKGIRALADDLFFNLKAFQWLLKHGSSYDLLHVQGRSGLLYALWPWRSRPCIVTFHGLTREEFRNSRRLGWVSPDQTLHQWLFHRLEKMAYRKAEGVITVSEFMRQHLQQHLRGYRWEVGVISNGVDLKRFQQPNSGSLTVTYLGRLDPNKGLRSLPILLSQLPQSLRLRWWCRSFLESHPA